MSRGTILLAEDNGRLRRLYADSLRFQDYDVHDFESGELLLAAVGRLSPDLVVLDIGMRDTDGIEICRRARLALNPRVPVIILTGFEDPQLVETAFAAGADDFIVKSGTLGAILDRLTNWVARSGIVNLPAHRRQILDQLRRQPASSSAMSAHAVRGEP